MTDTAAPWGRRAMSTPITTTVWVAYSSYGLSEPDLVGVEAELAAHGTSNGLVTVAPGSAMVWSGTHTGHVKLTLDLRPDLPPLDLDAWDEVVEVTVAFATGQAHVTEWGGTPRRELPNLARAGPGSYRLRCHARGRDQASGLALPPGIPVDDDDAIEFVDEAHLLAIWPAPPGDVVVYQATDQFGADRRAEASRRAPTPRHQQQ
jgi:hypothetical protein